MTWDQMIPNSLIPNTTESLGIKNEVVYGAAVETEKTEIAKNVINSKRLRSECRLESRF